MILVAPPSLQTFVKEVFEVSGFSTDDAVTAAGVLLQADLRGIDSHGVARLQGYLTQIEDNRINPNAQPKLTKDFLSVANMDADKSLGLVVTQKAMKIAMEKAEKTGSGWVSIHHSSHFGIAAAHANLALEKDMIGFAMTNASPLVSPAGGNKAMLGTNPICVSIPAGEKPPFIMDMATTTVANGKLEIAARQQKPIPHGWAQDKNGLSSTDALSLQKGGTLLPLGSDLAHASYKGYALGGWVDLMCGVLSGANYGPWVPPFVSFLQPAKSLPGKGIGHFVGAWKIEAFEELPVFKQNMDKWIAAFEDVKPIDGVEKVMIPGEKERQFEKERKSLGIPLNPKVWESLINIAEKTQVQLPKLL